MSNMVSDLFGRDVWSEFIKQNPEDLLEIKRKFEAKKRGLTAKPTEATIPYPPSLFKTYIEKRQVKSIQEGIEKSRYSQTYGICRLFKELFHNFRGKSEFVFNNFNCLRITGFLNPLLYRFNLSLLNVSLK
jgi:hypothetical protein